MKRLRQAQERFRHLLSENAPESEWQALFTEHPYVLSRSLPLRLSHTDIVPMARPGYSDPDFIFYQRSQSLITGYGVIELKRPSSRVLTTPRRNVVILTREAETAVKQAVQYAQSLILPERALFLGASAHLFVIMGLSPHLIATLASDVMRTQTDGIIPRGCQILPYDEILRRFEETLSRQVIVLTPTLTSEVTGRHERLPPEEQEEFALLQELAILEKRHRDLGSILLQRYIHADIATANPNSVLQEYDEQSTLEERIRQLQDRLRSLRDRWA